MEDKIVTIFRKGPVLAIDPLDRGEMILANHVYDLHHTTLSNMYMIDRTNKQLLALYKSVGDLNFKLDLTEEHVENLGKIAYGMTEELNRENSDLGIASSFLKSFGAILMVVPGVAPMFGIGTFAFGAGLGIINDLSTHQVNRDLSRNRLMFFDNLFSNMSESKILYEIKKQDDYESRGEKFVEHIESYHKSLLMQESVIREMSTSHRLEFYRVRNSSNCFFILVKIHSDVRVVMGVACDVMKKYYQVYETSLLRDNSYGRLLSMVSSNFESKAKFNLISSTGIFTSDVIIRKRVISLPSFLSTLSGTLEDISMAAHLYLQMGLKGGADK